MRPALRDDPRNLVEMARRAHLYPSRTQKLSAAAATIVRECDNSAPPGSERTGRSFLFSNYSLKKGCCYKFGSSIMHGNS